MNDRLDDLYDDFILDHYECPYHKGHLDEATCKHTDRNPLCGDQITLQLQLDDEGRVVKAYFDGRGCAISQASASILCEAIEGKTVEELRGLQAQEVLDLIKVPLSISRQKCGLLGFKILKTIVYSIDEAEQPVGSC